MRLPRIPRPLPLFPLALLLVALFAGANPMEPVPRLRAWTNWIPISSYGCVNPDIAADPLGNVYAVWEREQDGEIFLRERSQGTWLSPIRLALSAGPSRMPRIATDSRGWLHVVWSEGTKEGSDTYYAYWDRIAWSALRNLSQSPYESLTPAIAVDNANEVHVVWVEKIGANREVFYCSGDGTVWSTPVNLSNTPGRSEHPDIALDADGNVHVVWQEGMPSPPEVWHRFRRASGWSSVFNVSRNPSFSRQPAIVGDRTGRAIAVWDDNATGTSELHVAFWEGGEWSPVKSILIMPSGITTRIDLVVDEANVLHILWDDVVVDQWEIYYIRWNGQVWSSVQDLSHNWGYSFRPALALDAHGILHAVWTDSEPFFPSEGIVYCWQAADAPLPAYPTATSVPTSTPTAAATPTTTPPAAFHRYLPIVIRH